MREYRNVDASKLITMHCGGRLDYLYEAQNVADLQTFISAHEDFYVLGNGTNTIFGDGLITIPVIALDHSFDYLNEQDGIITAGAAASTARLLNYCADNGFSGAEHLAGIPGSLGGAVRMNAGTADWGIMEAVQNLSFVDQHGNHRLDSREIEFAYRRCNLPPRMVITEITFKLVRTRPEDVRHEIEKKLLGRKGQPHGYSSGCIFKNPQDDSAGRLIDAAGLKGTRIGGALVSDAHANFIINEGKATATDIQELIRTVKHTVKQRCGVELEEEVRIVV